MSKDLIEKTLAMKKWAVVGANDDPAKFGHIIYETLKQRGYTVYPVNSRMETINGEKCYAHFADLPETPEVVDMVVNPRTGLKIMEEIRDAGIKYVWMQPGTRSDEIREFAKANGIELIEDCVLVRA